MESSTTIGWSKACRQFEFPEIQLATDDFDESRIIGEGGSAKVYRGSIYIGSTLVDAAIKRLDSGFNKPEFWTEVEMLSELRHCHLVSLFGYCNHRKEMILVYEYMPNGTLADHLHKLGTPLSWVQRLKICIGAANGLHYLHTGTGIEFGVLHRDVKTTNILLTETWAPKISDFGLSLIAPRSNGGIDTAVKGSFGYIDPHYLSTGTVTLKSDVYAFGVVLLEVLSRKPAVDTRLHEKHIIDSDIKGEISRKCLKEFIRIVKRCLLSNPKQRSTMAEVVVGLESVLALQDKVNGPMPPTTRRTKFDMVPLVSKAEKSGISSSSIPCRPFKIQEIRLATGDFNKSRVIGQGGYGKVYKGSIYYGSTPIDAAIKRLHSSSNQGEPEFQAEVQVLSKVQHPHVVSLFGYCKHEKEKILVYEYMTNRTLSDHLHELGTPLSWLQRLNICIGVARGLHFLHTGMEFQVVHRDVKSSNILLNESWVAKLTDFGMSLSLIDPVAGDEELVKGTFGYLDPEYYNTGVVTAKSDVYGFGVVLLEVLCRRHAVDARYEDGGLVSWALGSIEKGKLKHIVDSDIRGEISKKCLKEFVRIVEGCLLFNAKKRPTMAEVVVGLEYVLTLQEKVNRSSSHVDTILFGRVVDNFVSAQGDSEPSRTTTIRDRIQISEEIKFPGLKEFKFDDLKRATSNFSENLMLKEDYYSRVYLGWFDKETFVPSTLGVGIAVAVKRQNQPNDEEWVTELKVLVRVAHPNIISLLGYCCDKNNGHLLVYEYMQNGSLDHFLHGETPQHNIDEPLSWETRVAIMIGVARGLVHLHSSEVIHCDVNSSRILLDQDFNAKLVDFGFAKVSPEIGRTHNTTVVIGTFGYLDPDYVETGRVTVKSDIYSFGVLLLETLTGSKPFDPIRHHLVTWATPFLTEISELKKIMDPLLEEKYPLEGAFECAALAQRCVAHKPKDRPSSEQVLQCLEQIYALHK